MGGEDHAQAFSELDNDVPESHDSGPRPKPRPKSKSNSAELSDSTSFFTRRKRTWTEPEPLVLAAKKPSPKLPQSPVLVLDSDSDTVSENDIIYIEDQSEYLDTGKKAEPEPKTKIDITIYPPLSLLETLSEKIISLASNCIFLDAFQPLRDELDHNLYFLYDMVQVSDWVTPEALLPSGQLTMKIYAMLKGDVDSLFSSTLRLDAWSQYIQQIEIALKSKERLKSAVLNEHVPTSATISLTIKANKGVTSCVLASLDPENCTVRQIEEMARDKMPNIEGKGECFLYFDGVKIPKDKKISEAQLEDGDCLELRWAGSI